MIAVTIGNREVFKLRVGRVNNQIATKSTHLCQKMTPSGKKWKVRQIATIHYLLRFRHLIQPQEVSFLILMQFELFWRFPYELAA